MAKNLPNEYIAQSYTGSLAKIFDEFVAFQRRRKIKYKSEAALLAEFDRFTLRHNFPKNQFTEEMFSLWEKEHPLIHPKTRSAHRTILRSLAEFMIDNGYFAYMPPVLWQKTPRDFMPYIFSEDELRRLFTAKPFVQDNRGKYQFKMYPLIFRLLYGCGLRLSEALKLKISDIDFTENILTIRDTKFEKTRYVPMCESLSRLCCDFLKIRHINPQPDEWFFKSKDGGVYSVGTIYATFRAYLKSAGISHGGRGKGPRIHDLRHTFAIHCLRKFMREDSNVEEALRVLSAYMGHSETKYTHTYLRLSAELFPEIHAKLNTFSPNIIPHYSEEDFEDY
jgi:integrase